jgi:hypothetical protein
MIVTCIQAKLVSFSVDSMITHPIRYHDENTFGFCQEDEVEMVEQPYLRYDTDKKLLEYHFWNNHSYYHVYAGELDADSIRLGQFKYINGEFILQKETVEIQRNLDDE